MYAYFTLNRWGWKPSDFVHLPIKEKALVMAMIDEVIKTEKKANKKRR